MYTPIGPLQQESKHPSLQKVPNGDGIDLNEVLQEKLILGSLKNSGQKCQWVGGSLCNLWWLDQKHQVGH